MPRPKGSKNKKKTAPEAPVMTTEVKEAEESQQAPKKEQSKEEFITRVKPSETILQKMSAAEYQEWLEKNRG